MKRHLFPLSLLLGSVIAGYGALTMVEDFDSVADWSSNGSSSNTLTATGGVGELLMVSNTSTSHYIGLGGNAIANGSTGTIFFQVINPSDGDPIDHFSGFSVGDNPGPYSGYNGYIFSSNNGGGPFNYQARDGGGGTATSTALAADTTYNVWMVVNNSAKTYDVYINTGTAAATAGDLVWSGLAFRTNTDPAGLAVDTFGLFGQDSQNTNRTVSYDNLYVDNTGATLLNPVPEPSTYALLAGLLTLGMVMIRRRMK